MIIKNNDLKQDFRYFLKQKCSMLAKSKVIGNEFEALFTDDVYFKNAKNAVEVINMVPLEKLLIETDSPYLSPEPFRGEKNSSKYIPLIAKRVSEILNLEIDEVARITCKNACSLFDLK